MFESLDEDDIRAIAERRYSKQVGKSYWIGLLVLVGAPVVIALAVPEPYNQFAYVPMSSFVVWVVRHMILLNRFTKAMVESWRKEHRTIKEIRSK
jgi:hypothetical protein